MFEQYRKICGIICIIICLALILSGIFYENSRRNGEYRSSYRINAGELYRPAIPNGTVNVNFCSAEEMTALPGIGETISSEIINEREKNGVYYYPEDLLCIRGIGSQKLNGIRKLLDLSH